MSKNETAITTQETTNIFKQMESFDEMQITNPKLQQKLAYKHSASGKIELTYAGIKQLILQMSQAGQALEIVSKECVKDKVGNDELWRTEVILRNKKTNHETWGVSENWVNKTDFRTGAILDEYDPFGRTKAVSKAIRNAERQQLPEILITTFIEKLQEKEPDAIQQGETVTSRPCTCENGGFFARGGNICNTCGGGRQS